jgi:hypothetical protein
MTPGYGKPRSELPWLPYEEQDRVIINSHNFTPVWTPAVNGKMPVAAWVPSRDNAGNGTTTLTDLVGSNNATLTNMDPSTDWVADTDAGGIRALDFDGSNDTVSTTLTSFNPTDFACSVWGLRTGSTSYRTLVSKYQVSGAGFDIGCDSTTIYAQFLRAGNSYTFISWSSAIIGTGWHHFLVTRNGSTLTLYVDGVLRATGNVGTASISTATPFRLSGILSTAFWWSGRIDDARLFSVGLDAADAADLYAAQRGGNAA